MTSPTQKSRAKTAAWNEIAGILGIKEEHASWFQREGWFPPSPDNDNLVIISEARYSLGCYKRDEDCPDWAAKRAQHRARQDKAAAGRAAARKKMQQVVRAEPAPPAEIAPPTPPPKEKTAPVAPAATAPPPVSHLESPDISPAKAAEVVEKLAEDGRAAPLAYPDDPLKQAKFRKTLADARRAERLDAREAGSVVDVRHARKYARQCVEFSKTILDQMPSRSPKFEAELREAADWAKAEILKKWQSLASDMQRAHLAERRKGDEKG